MRQKTKRKTYDAQIVIMVRRGDRVALERLAKKEERSLSAQVRHFLKPHLVEAREREAQ